MTKGERYRSTIAQLEAAGLVAYMMRQDQLVFASKRAKLGKSGWLPLHEDKWLFGTW